MLIEMTGDRTNIYMIVLFSSVRTDYRVHRLETTRLMNTSIIELFIIIRNDILWNRRQMYYFVLNEKPIARELVCETTDGTYTGMAICK